MDKELKIEAVKLSPNEQYLIRKNIVRLLLQKKSNSEIAEILGVSERHVRSVRKTYSEKGMEGLKPRKRGHEKGKNLILTPEQEEEIQKILIDKTPDQLGEEECMWTRKAIQHLIQKKYRISIRYSTLGVYLARWGFTSQRPAKRAYGQDKEKVDRWLNEEFPGIVKRAIEENAEIFFGDETNIQNTANYMRGYSPKGKTPVVCKESKKLKINMLSAVTKRGKLRFVLYKDNMNAGKLIDFMRRLIRESRKKVFLILDNLKVHHAKKVTGWLEKHKEQIKVFYLPPYSPEYNPDELINSDLKRGVGAKASPRSEKELEHLVRSHLKKLQLCPDKISAFFSAEFVSYAA